MKTVLILWLTFMNTPRSNVEGAISMHDFDSPAACIAALRAVRETAEYISGVCVPRDKVTR